MIRNNFREFSHLSVYLVSSLGTILGYPSHLGCVLWLGFEEEGLRHVPCQHVTGVTAPGPDQVAPLTDSTVAQYNRFSLS